MSPPLAAIDGKYEIVTKLKEGGMGAIYKVRHRLLDEIRVIKVLRPQFEDDAELRERFAREARSAIKLRHPNVVQLFDFSLEDTGAGSIVMEFIDGIDLNQVIQHRRLPSIPLALEIARQSLRALGFLHQHGFVHRDVSPDNLMLTLDHDQLPLVKLIDLGIAKRRDSPESITVSGSFLGKFRYASPEHFGARGPNGVEARSDLYTFGLVFYELLTGRYPIQAEGTSHLIAAHLFQPALDFHQSDPEGRVPDHVRWMLLRSLAKSPDERQESAGAWIAEIERLQQSHWPLDERAIREAQAMLDETRTIRAPTFDERPGSTQREFDRQFGAEKTPTRASTTVFDAEEATHISSVALPPATSLAALTQQAEAQLHREMMTLVAEAESRIDLGDDAGAMTLLRRAQQAALPLIQSRPETQAELASALVRLNRKVMGRTGPSPAMAAPPAAPVEPAKPVPPAMPTDDPPLAPGVGLLVTLADIEKLREEGRLVSAWTLLRKALERFGEHHPDLLEIRAALAEELLGAAEA